MSAAIILLNGYPGVGKNSIAVELAKVLPNSKIFNHHLLHETALSLYDREEPAFPKVLKGFRQAVFDSLSCPTVQNTIYILTDTLTSSHADRQVLAEYLQFAKSTHFIFVHLIISCDTLSNVARLEKRLKEIKSHTKVIDENGLMELRMEEEIPHLVTAREIRERKKVEGLSGEYELDTSNMGVEQAAGTCAEYVLDTVRNEGWWIQLNRPRAVRRPQQQV